VWREDGPTKGQCLWEMHGVWKWDEKEGKGVVMREAYFKRDENGKEVCIVSGKPSKDGV
jgi:hypothetical protein